MPASELVDTSVERLDRGLAGIWSTALATALVLTLLLVLLWIVSVNAFGWFWPATVWELRLADGSVVIGQEVGREPVPETGERD